MSAPILVPAFNRRGVGAIYRFELARFGRTLWTCRRVIDWWHI